MINDNEEFNDNMNEEISKNTEMSTESDLKDTTEINPDDPIEIENNDNGKIDDIESQKDSLYKIREQVLKANENSENDDEDFPKAPPEKEIRRKTEQELNQEKNEKIKNDGIESKKREEDLLMLKKAREIIANYNKNNINDAEEINDKQKTK